MMEPTVNNNWLRHNFGLIELYCVCNETAKDTRDCSDGVDSLMVLSITSPLAVTGSGFL